MRTFYQFSTISLETLKLSMSNLPIYTTGNCKCSCYVNFRNPNDYY